MLKKITLILTGLCLTVLLAGSFRLIKKNSTLQNSSNAQSQKPAPHSGRAVHKSQSVIDLPAKDTQLAQLSNELKALISLWNSIGNSYNLYNIQNDEFTIINNLVTETLEKLSCGPELSSLLDYLHLQDYGPAAVVLINDAVEKLLVSSTGTAAREDLLTLSAEDSEDSLTPKERWARYAGAGCDQHTIHQYLHALESSEPEGGKGPALRQDALLGYAAKLAKTEPESALSLAVEQFAVGIDSHDGVTLSKEIAWALHPDTDFAKTQETILKPNGHQALSSNDQRYTELQNEFVKKWADIDPTEAACYYIAHAESSPPSFITNITVIVSMRDPMAGAKWARTFPEGQYRDAALLGALQTLILYPDEARRVANEIQAPALRVKAEKILTLVAQEIQNLPPNN